ncbi:GMC oxidoreductase [Alcanivorax sp. S6407]|uniref:GMC oxidoreductase n=1 Tax=Alcanivorax sp. S6407 TaxID=2926424 RepID=UPI001FF104A4|nr:GMC oxidoreductase [Alcanivorax sp. S6407]MCK0153101.1 GMC oxidoreductase [Alcanivorax sp. S6407]
MPAAIQPHSTIVIGSGFGGAVAASTLVDAGESVLLLERGPWRDTSATREAGIDRRAPLPAGRHALTGLIHRIGHRRLSGLGWRWSRRGLFDIHLGRDMTVVASNSVGGGSHVYSAMNTRPEDGDYWERPEAGIRAADMDKHYQWMLERMGARQARAEDRIPNWTPQAFANTTAFVADDSVPQPAMAIRMDGQQEDYANNSFFGSANGAKMTLDRALLLPAMERGLEVAAEHECLSLWRLADGGYRLEVMDYAARRRRYLLADRVILAAGTLNTLRLLFRSRALGGLGGMPALGHGFAGNGDCVAWWALNQEGADFTRGTATHGRFALRDPRTGKAQPGPNLSRYGFNGIDTLPLPDMLKRRLRRDALLVAMGADQADGVASWHRGRLRIRYLADNSPILADIKALFAEVARRSQRPVRTLSDLPFTVHPLGGARLAGTEKDGVVDGSGQVFGHPHLYVADAAALPAAPGTPPSMTIAAWSRHVALGLARAIQDHPISANENRTTA